MKAVITYIVLFGALQNLVQKQSYRDIFRFVGGLILMVLVVQMICLAGRGQDLVGEWMQRAFHTQQIRQMRQQLYLEEDRRKEHIRKQTVSWCKSQTKELAAQEGLTVREVKVTWNSKKDQIKTLRVRTEGNPGKKDFSQILRRALGLGKKQVFWVTDGGG